MPPPGSPPRRLSPRAWACRGLSVLLLPDNWQAANFANSCVAWMNVITSEVDYSSKVPYDDFELQPLGDAFGRLLLLGLFGRPRPTTSWADAAESLGPQNTTKQNLAATRRLPPPHHAQHCSVRKRRYTACCNADTSHLYLAICGHFRLPEWGQGELRTKINVFVWPQWHHIWPQGTFLRPNQQAAAPQKQCFEKLVGPLPSRLAQLKLLLNVLLNGAHLA